MFCRTLLTHPSIHPTFVAFLLSGHGDLSREAPDFPLVCHIAQLLWGNPKVSPDQLGKLVLDLM